MEQQLKSGGSGSSGGSGGSVESKGQELSIRETLEILSTWINKYVVFQNPKDLDIIPLWIIHTWLLEKGLLYTTPRLLIDSPMPGSGKTTLLTHLEKFCNNAIPISSLPGVAVLGRLTDQGITTLLIDEADRTLDPKRKDVAEIIAHINSGYVRGGNRVLNLTSTKKGEDWKPKKMSTFSPVAIAGNTPNIPDDTRSRCLVVRLLPDTQNRAQDSDWEELDIWAYQIKLDIEASVPAWSEQIRGTKPPLPKECTNRFRDKWKPLKRIAVLAGEDWAKRVDQYILQDIQTIKEQDENGDSRQSIHIQLAKDLYEIFEGEPKFMGTETLVSKLPQQNWEYWGESSLFPRGITPQRLGRLLNGKFGFNSQRNTEGVRGYHSKQFEQVWESLGLTLNKPTEPPKPTEPTEPEATHGETW